MTEFLEPLGLLTHRAFDYPQYDSIPKRRYLIASCHRSGSSVIALQLWAKGCVGAPWEYFNERFNIRPLASRFDVSSAAAYLEALYKYRTSPNGVFGFKLVPSQWTTFCELFATAMAPLEEIRVVYVTRQDRVAQAVSLFRAFRTNRWSSVSKPYTATEVYNGARIKELYAVLCSQEVAWRRACVEHGWSPYHVVYEQYLKETDMSLERICEYLEVPQGGGESRVMVPKLQRQSDHVSEEWVARFRDEEAEWLDEQRYGGV